MKIRNLSLPLIFLFIAGCTSVSDSKSEIPSISSNIEESPPIISKTPLPVSSPASKLHEEIQLRVEIGDEVFIAELADTKAAEALTLLLENPLTIQVSDYGSFEKIGRLPQNLPQEDIQTTAAAGDIMLYQGDSIVFFYGENSWSYTRLATFNNVSESVLKKALNPGITELTLSLTINE